MSDELQHLKTTPEGFTHWSSGPGNLTFDPSCPRCWEIKVGQMQGHITEALRYFEGAMIVDPALVSAADELKAALNATGEED